MIIYTLLSCSASNRASHTRSNFEEKISENSLPEDPNSPAEKDSKPIFSEEFMQYIYYYENRPVLFSKDLEGLENNLQNLLSNNKLNLLLEQNAMFLTDIGGLSTIEAIIILGNTNFNQMLDKAVELKVLDREFSDQSFSIISDFLNKIGKAKITLKEIFKRMELVLKKSTTSELFPTIFFYQIIKLLNLELTKEIFKIEVLKPKYPFQILKWILVDQNDKEILEMKDIKQILLFLFEQVVEDTTYGFYGQPWFLKLIDFLQDDENSLKDLRNILIKKGTDLISALELTLKEYPKTPILYKVFPEFSK